MRRVIGHHRRRGAVYQQGGRGSRLRFVDREGAPGQGRAVQASNRVLGRVAVWHLDEAKTPRAARVAVGHNADRVDGPIRFKELAEILLRGRKGQTLLLNSGVLCSRVVRAA